MKLLFLRKFINSDTKYLLESLSSDYEIVIPEDYSDENLTKLIKDSDVCLGNNISKAVSENMGNLRLFQVPGAGVNQLDLGPFREQNVMIGNSHSNAEYVAEYAISLLFALLKKTHHHDRFIREGIWFRPRGDESDFPFLSDTIFNKRLGFIGFGNIGQRIARMLSGFNLKSLVFSKSNHLMFDDDCFQNNISFANLTTVLKESDILFVTLPLTEETRNLLSSQNIGYLKKSAYLINVSRAQIIDKKALYEGLSTGGILGAALDVWYDDGYEQNGKKYPSSEFPFHELNNIVLSAYRAGYVMQSSPHLKGVIENLLSFARNGKLICEVNLQKGY
jgi:phosphoglycerate dehydrogenase-like enzyme